MQNPAGLLPIATALGQVAKLIGDARARREIIDRVRTGRLFAVARDWFEISTPCDQRFRGERYAEREWCIEVDFWRLAHASDELDRMHGEDRRHTISTAQDWTIGIFSTVTMPAIRDIPERHRFHLTSRRQLDDIAWFERTATGVVLNAVEVRRLVAALGGATAALTSEFAGSAASLLPNTRPAARRGDPAEIERWIAEWTGDNSKVGWKAFHSDPRFKGVGREAFFVPAWKKVKGQP